MGALQLPMHGRNHAPGGSDPIPSSDTRGHFIYALPSNKTVTSGAAGKALAFTTLVTEHPAGLTTYTDRTGTTGDFFINVSQGTVWQFGINLLLQLENTHVYTYWIAATVNPNVQGTPELWGTVYPEIGSLTKVVGQADYPSLSATCMAVSNGSISVNNQFYQKNSGSYSFTVVGNANLNAGNSASYLWGVRVA